MEILLILTAILGFFVFFGGVFIFLNGCYANEEKGFGFLTCLFVVCVGVVAFLLSHNLELYNDSAYRYKEVPTFQNEDKTFYSDDQGKVRVFSEKTKQVYLREKDLSSFWLNRKTYVSSKEN